MSNENTNKAVVSRWFDKFGGNTWDLSIVDEIAAPDMLLKLIRFSGRACILYLGDEGPFRFNSFE